MENIQIVKVDVNGDLQEVVIIDRGNGEYTSMTKAEYERQQAELNN